jgi:hypothetical protein
MICPPKGEPNLLVDRHRKGNIRVIPRSRVKIIIPLVLIGRIRTWPGNLDKNYFKFVRFSSRNFKNTENNEFLDFPLGRKYIEGISRAVGNDSS